MTNKNIIHFSADDYWNSNPHSRFHIVNSFYKKGYKVFWINPVGHRFPSIKQKGFIKRIFRKLKSYIKLLQRVQDDFYVFTPILIPKFTEGYSQNINRLLLNFQISFFNRLLAISNPILFISTPMFGDAVDIVRYSKAIYYYSDKYSTFRELTDENKEFMKKLDNNLLAKVDLISCASKMIYNEIKRKTDKLVLYTPHQVDFEFFHNALKKDYLPFKIKKISKPIVGYYGTLTKSTDWELLLYCAKNRPNYNFVFIGRDEIEYESLINLPNVYILGKVPYKDIPFYGKEFDVCISAFIRETWIINSSPLKLKEYLCLEKPVVSTYIEEVEKLYKEIIYISKNKNQFLKYLDDALENDNSERIRKGIDLVKKDSWDKVVTEFLEKLNKLEKK